MKTMWKILLASFVSLGLLIGVGIVGQKWNAILVSRFVMACIPLWFYSTIMALPAPNIRLSWLDNFVRGADSLITAGAWVGMCVYVASCAVWISSPHIPMAQIFEVLGYSWPWLVGAWLILALFLEMKETV
jgi:hypothetical protein